MKRILNLKNRYEFDCPRCGGKHYAQPSIMMSVFQLNVGGGHCLEKKTPKISD